MKEEFAITILNELATDEAQMVINAHNRYGMFSQLVEEINLILSNFVEGIKSEDAWVIMPPLATCRTSYTLVLI